MILISSTCWQRQCLTIYKSISYKLFLTTLVMLAGCTIAQSNVTQEIPPGFVELGSITPEQVIPISTEVRYFSADNFVGVPIDGYRTARIYLSEEAALALFRVQLKLNELGFGLKVFDGYRPQQAVDHFVRWAQDLNDTVMKQRYYPRVAKENLFLDGYIAALSGHSRGSTVDLTIIDSDSGEELNMGTPWDFFDINSWPSSSAVTAQQRANRMLLRSVMMAQGFQPLEQEWWHFTLQNEPYPETFFDFQVR